MKNPLVSIITASYNQGHFIEDTILSVLNQDYSNIEHIIIDGGSTDNTLDILQKYGYTNRIVWISEKDEGQSDAYNKGFRISKGEIIGFLNSDDVYLSRNAISSIVDYFLKNPSIDIIYGDSAWIDANNVILRINLRPDFSIQRLYRFNFIPHPATFIKREAFKETLYNTNLKFAIDYDLWIRLARKGYKFAHIKQLIGGIRVHPNTKSSRFRNELWEEGYEIIADAIQVNLSYYFQIAFDIFLLTGYKIKGLFYFLNLENKVKWTLDFKLPSIIKRIIYQLSLNGPIAPLKLFIQKFK